MNIYNLNDMIKGWFVGNFEPAVLKTEQFEVAIKKYKANEREKAHYHKVAKEITVIVSGKVVMNGVEYSENDIILLDENDATDFYAVTDVITVVVKMPSAINDKYEVK